MLAACNAVFGIRESISRCHYFTYLREHPDITVRTQFASISGQMRKWRRKETPVQPQTLAGLAEMLENPEFQHYGRTVVTQHIPTEPLFRGAIGTPPHSLFFMSEGLKS